MASRVERYYDKNVEAKRRSVKNRDLYKSIYEDESYSNIEGIVETPKTNEIDITKVQELLHKQEEEEKRRNHLVKKDLEIPEMESLDDELDKKYDIRDVLAQAKEDQPEENRVRSLKDIDFSSLKKKLKNREKYSNEEVERDLSDIKELMSTIAGNNSELNKLADKDLSLDMFSDLVASTRELSSEDSDAIKKLIAEAKKIEEEKNKENEVSDIDKSFYTTTLKLKKKDFETEEDEEEKNNTGFKIAIIVLILLIIISFVIAGYIILK